MNLAGVRLVGLAARASLALVAIGCAVPAYRYAEVAALRTNAPLQAAKLVPHDATALANALGSRFDDNPGFKPSSGEMTDIRTALAAQPLEPKLLSIMGLAYEVAGDLKRASNAMRLANRANRRDSVSGLYLIESASGSGDVKTTLMHYNILLLAQPGLNARLLPILSSAIAYPEVRAEMRPYLQTGAKWGPAFLAVAAEKGSVTDLQALLLPLPKVLLGDEYAPMLASVLLRMAVEGDRTSALRFAAAIVPGLSTSALSSLSLDPTTRDPRLGQFAWVFPPINGIQVEAGDDNYIQLNANPLTSGVVAVRNLLLEAGVKYELVQRLKYDPGSVGINVRWSADCLTPTRTARFWEQRMPISVAQQGSYRSDFTVPQDCKVVRLSLFAEGPEGQMPATLALGEFLLSRKN